jgi:photosystem II stability/assembly factor-like uncharacterized protein
LLEHRTRKKTGALKNQTAAPALQRREAAAMRTGGNEGTKSKSSKGPAPKKRKRGWGGKALQRLFHYLGRRDQQLNEELLKTLSVPKAVRPKLYLSLRAKALPVRKGPARKSKQRPAHPATQALANSLVQAATLLNTQPRPRSRLRVGLAAAVGIQAPRWESIGPTQIPNGQTYGTNTIAVIGRVACIAVDPGDAKHLLCGSAGGGIWESTNQGTSWAPRTDQMPSLATGAIAFDPGNAKTVYAGSGEGNFYYNLGAGIYRSTDGGTTWQVHASAPFIGVGFFALVVDPNKTSRLYAGTTAGLYVSGDSGKTWTQRRAGLCWAISAAKGGANAEILAACQDGLFASTSGGATFTAVSLPSKPAATWSRLAVDHVAGTPDVAYVFGAAGDKGHFWRRSGGVWKKAAKLPTGLEVSQADYDWYVAAAPDDAKRVYLGAIDGYRGDLTGAVWKWTNITTNNKNSIHPDQHCLAFAPGDSKTIFAGSDGGLFLSRTAGAKWEALNNGMAITEVEYLAFDPDDWRWIMAGTQDNGTLNYTGTTSWLQIAQGDGGDCGVNPLNAKEVYHSYYYVSLEGSTNKAKTWTDLKPQDMESLFYPPVSVFGQTVCIGGTALQVSRDRGANWTLFKLKLAARDVATSSCMPDADTIYVGTQFGQVFKAVWGGNTWTITSLTQPFKAYISCIATDPSNPQRLWVTSSWNTVGNGMVCGSNDGGATWSNVTGNLPPIPKNSVVVDPANENRVFIAADIGVYQSLDLGATWTPFSEGLPNAIAADLVFHAKARKLICGTRNRGVWVIDVP